MYSLLRVSPQHFSFWVVFGSFFASIVRVKNFQNVRINLHTCCVNNFENNFPIHCAKCGSLKEILAKNGTNGMHITINGSHCAKNYIYPACMKEGYRHHKHEEHSTKYFLFKMKKKIRFEIVGTHIRFFEGVDQI